MDFQERMIQFQSTLPAWGETKARPAAPAGDDFNPLSPHGERLGGNVSVSAHGTISIHSPRMGRDLLGKQYRLYNKYFNPLSPHGERLKKFGNFASQTYFNPLSPHGERLAAHHGRNVRQRFQSTLPAWGETKSVEGNSPVHGKFQSTLPAWGETNASSLCHGVPIFQSTLPAWGETVGHGRADVAVIISIHSPRMGRDRASWKIRN